MLLPMEGFLVAFKSSSLITNVVGVQQSCSVCVVYSSSLFMCRFVSFSFSVLWILPEKFSFPILISSTSKRVSLPVEFQEMTSKGVFTSFKCQTCFQPLATRFSCEQKNKFNCVKHFSLQVRTFLSPVCSGWSQWSSLWLFKDKCSEKSLCILLYFILFYFPKFFSISFRLVAAKLQFWIQTMNWLNFQRNQFYPLWGLTHCYGARPCSTKVKLHQNLQLTAV